MATTNVDGTGADFSYTPQGGSATTHLLAVQLMIAPREQARSRRNARVFSAWKVDLTARETFTVGTPVDELELRIRFDDEPSSLRSMLEEGLENDVTLTYRPTGSGGSTYPAKLVSVEGSETAVSLVPDADRFAYGEYQARILLRRVDSGDFEGLL